MSDWVQRSNLPAHCERLTHKADGSKVLVYKDSLQFRFAVGKAVQYRSTDAVVHGSFAPVTRCTYKKNGEIVVTVADGCGTLLRYKPDGPRGTNTFDARLPDILAGLARHDISGIWEGSVRIHPGATHGSWLDGTRPDFAIATLSVNEYLFQFPDDQSLPVKAASKDDLRISGTHWIRRDAPADATTVCASADFDESLRGEGILEQYCTVRGARDGMLYRMLDPFNRRMLETLCDMNARIVSLARAMELKYGAGDSRVAVLNRLLAWRGAQSTLAEKSDAHYPGAGALAVWSAGMGFGGWQLMSNGWLDEHGGERSELFGSVIHELAHGMAEGGHSAAWCRAQGTMQTVALDAGIWTCSDAAWMKLLPARCKATYVGDNLDACDWHPTTVSLAGMGATPPTHTHVRGCTCCLTLKRQE